MEKNQKIVKIGNAFRWILGILYIPLSLFCWLLQMASEGAIGATNPLYILLIDMFCVIAFIIPLLCVATMVVSVLLRETRHWILSLVIQFVPLGIFLLNWILLTVAESLSTIR